MTESRGGEPPDGEQAPVLAFVGGHPTAEQIAAVVTVLAARMEAAGPTGTPEPARSEWSARSRRLREPLLRGPGGWRASARPR
jgi:hypothetical protein